MESTKKNNKEILKTIKHDVEHLNLDLMKGENQYHYDLIMSNIKELMNMKPVSEDLSSGKSTLGLAMHNMVDQITKACDINELKNDIKELEIARVKMCDIMQGFNISPMEYIESIDSKMWKITHRRYTFLKEFK